MSKNILIISAVFPPEPVVSAKLSFDIANALSDSNSVTVISPRPSRPLGFIFANRVPDFKFRHVQANSFIYPSSHIFGRLKESFSFGKYCYNYIIKNHESIDLIYVNTWPLIGQYLAVNAARKHNIPLILHVQDIYPESLANKFPFLTPLLNFLLLPMDKYSLRNSTAIIAISEIMKAHLSVSRNIEPKKIAVIQNWQDESAFISFKAKNKKQTSHNNLFTFMYLGNIGPVAGIDFLIEAFAKANLQNCRLVIVGSGSLKESLQRKTNNRRLKAIEFWDVADGKVPEIQNQADIMLLPIRKGATCSSIPSKLPAYMFSEKPIIACVDCNCDIAKAITKADCGWVLYPEDQHTLIKIMKSVAYLSRSELQQKGRNGFEYALEHFSKPNNLGKLIQIINKKMQECTTEK